MQSPLPPNPRNLPIHYPNLTWNCMLLLRSPNISNMNLWYSLNWFLFPRKSCNYFFNKITPKLTWNLKQAQNEPKLHPANMEFKQVVNPIFHFALRSRYRVFNLGGAIAIPVKHSTQQIMWKSIESFLCLR